jgi:hypothetical protein
MPGKNADKSSVSQVFGQAASSLTGTTGSGNAIIENSQNENKAISC